VNPVGPNLTQLSSDPFTTATEQHATEVEPHLLSNGSTLVAAFQTGRNPTTGGGSTGIGWATSTDGGTTWTHGFLPGLTAGDAQAPGPYDRASDPNVAYDAKHQVWMISSLPIANVQTPAVVVSVSPDGITWSNPFTVDATSASSDKNWIVCDSTATSPHYGNCYVEWDHPNSDQIFMNTSSDGGQTWGSALATASGAFGIGGQPLVQPNGNVVVPIEQFTPSGLNGVTASISAFSSSNGGATWSAPVIISNIQLHNDAGGIRSGPLPSAAIDGAGTIWVVWEDCRFRAMPNNTCYTNDLVYSTSSDGVNWSPVTRIPIDNVTTTADYFIPGIGIDPATSGANAHVAVHYYYYSQTNCTKSNCQLGVGFISSANGGATWNTPSTLLQGPMQLGWLPISQNGLMVGDYIATAFVNGVPHGVFAVAQANSGSTFSEAIYTAQGLTVTRTARQLSSANDKPLHTKSDVIEQERPEKGVIPPQRKKTK
jgi:hypothetical protein